MKKVIIKDIEIKEFCGIKSMDVKFFETYTRICGSNGVGKTTIGNAICSLLTGKDIHGGDSKWQPYDENGELVESALCKLTMNLSVDNKEYEFKMSRENKGVKVDSYKIIYSINETIYLTVREYKKAVMELLGFEELENLISSFVVGYITNQSEAQAVKTILAFYNKTKEQVLNEGNFSEKVKKLILQDNPISTIKKIHTEKASECLTEIKRLDDRINDNKDTIKKHEGDNFEISKDKEATNKLIAEAKDEINLYDKYTQDRKNFMDKLKGLSNEITLKNKELTIIKAEKENHTNNNNDVVADYEKMKFESSNDCKICKARISKLEADGDIWSKKIEACDVKLVSLTKELEKFDKEIIETDAELNKLVAPEIDIIIKKQEIQALEKSLIDPNDVIKTLQSKVDDYEKEKEKWTTEKSEHDSNLESIEAYNICKAKLIEDEINKNNVAGFKIQLFRTQKNGSLKMSLHITYKGIPFNHMSTAQKMRANAMLVNKFQIKKGVRLPLIMDCHESIDSKIETDSQVIGLEVVKDQKTITIEGGQ